MKKNELVEGQPTLESLLNAIAGAIIILTNDGCIKFVNEAACELLRKKKKELIGADFSFPLTVNVATDMEIQVADEKTRHVHMQTSKIKWEDEPVFVVTLFDITAYKEIEEKLKVADSVFKYAKEGIVVTDANRNIVSVNDEFTHITGYSEKEVIGRNPNLLKSGKQDDAFYKEMWQHIDKNDFWVGQIWNKKKNGELYPELIAISTVKNEVGQVTHYIGLFYNITRQVEEQKKEIEQVEYYDKLTGLPNRNLVLQLIGNRMSGANSSQHFLSVIYIDIDKFKTIIDEHDAHFVDELTKKIAHVLFAGLKVNDVLSRYQEDEFIVVLSSLQDKAEYENYIDYVNRKLAIPIKINGEEITITASFGVTIYPQEKSVTPEQLVQQSQKALFLAKLKGVSKCIVFDPVREETKRQYHRYLDQLEQAMGNNEFVLYCQPKIQLETNKILGAEALLRWDCPGKGILTPGRFLPGVTSREFELKLDKWVVQSCVENILSLKGFDKDLIVSANIDALDLTNADFMHWLTELSSQHAGVIKQLEFEILESTTIDDLKKIAYLISKVNDLGIHFSLDDFGTSHSSLTYLKMLPLKYMKIDQGFVRGLLNSKQDVEILKGILALAKAINIKVIAEGAESKKHLALLRELGCEYAQGYAIAKPMPVDEFIKWCDVWNKKHKR